MPLPQPLPTLYKILDTVYAEIFARRKFSPILPVGVVGEILFHEYFRMVPCTVPPPTTSWRVARVLGEIKFGEIFVIIQCMSHWRNF